MGGVVEVAQESFPAKVFQAAKVLITVSPGTVAPQSVVPKRVNPQAVVGVGVAVGGGTDGAETIRLQARGAKAMRHIENNKNIFRIKFAHLHNF